MYQVFLMRVKLNEKIQNQKGKLKWKTNLKSLAVQSSAL